jgi:hypothetical protein
MFSSDDVSDIFFLDSDSLFSVFLSKLSKIREKRLYL